MASLLIDSHYFPPLTYLSSLSHTTHCYFYIYDRFQKMTFRNRCVIAGANGPITLSVPLKGGRDQKGFLKEIEIDQNTAWQSNHWKSICSCYNHSPWFDHYRESLRPFFEKEYRLLADLNLEVFGWVLQQLQWPLNFSISDLPDGHYHDLRNAFTPKKLKTLGTPFTYHQVFQERIGFQPHLSVLDLLFCTGPRAGELLK